MSTTELATTQAQPQTALKPASENLPAHLQRNVGDKPQGLSLLNQYVIPPRLKIVQGQSKPELKKEFPEGSVIVMPDKKMVAERIYDPATKRFADGCIPFHFTPLFFFPEYFCFNPIKLSHLPAIRERSTDGKSHIAKMSKRKETREQICPDDADGKELMRFRESLTFVVHIIDVEHLWGIPVTMSFMGGEFRTGQKFASDISQRATDLFGNVFQASTGLRTMDQFNWYGYNVGNPALGTVSQWVEDVDLYKFYKEKHEMLADAYASNLLMSDIDDEDRPRGDNVIDAQVAAKSKGEF